jgi:putative intracellular protease/amidase
MTDCVDETAAAIFSPGNDMNICMPVYDDVDMLDVTGPYEMFRWADITVELVAENPGPIRFRKGFCFEVKTSLEKVSPATCCGCPAAIRTRLPCRWTTAFISTS